MIGLSLLIFVSSKIDSVHIDFAKAFDSISHRKLPFKIEHYGFSPPLVRWLDGYPHFITDRFSKPILVSRYLLCWCSSRISA